MENTSENKAKFFAQYYGQKVLKSKGLGTFEILINNGVNWYHESFYLKLKTLSLITDEDAIELCKFLGYDDYETISRSDTDLTIFESHIKGYKPAHSIIISFVDHYLEWDNGESWEDNRTAGFNSSAYDFLRSKSYALPYLGISVEQQVEYGWVKLLTPNGK